MPNHCTNLLTLAGAPAEVARAVNLLRGTYPEYALSEDERRIYKAVGESTEKEEASPICFHKIIPVPDEVLARGYSKAGYNWQSDNWGTKWGAYDVDEDRLSDYEPGVTGYITYKFDTAWAPPIPVFDELARRFPELRLYHSFGEEYPTRGCRRWVAGKVDKHSVREETLPDSNEYIDSHEWRQLFLSMHGEWIQAIEDKIRILA